MTCAWSSHHKAKIGGYDVVRIVIADDHRPLGVLFGATAEGRGVSSRTERTVLAALQVRGVPDVALEEALWLAASAINA